MQSSRINSERSSLNGVTSSRIVTHTCNLDSCSTCSCVTLIFYCKVWTILKTFLAIEYLQFSWSNRIFRVSAWSISCCQLPSFSFVSLSCDGGNCDIIRGNSLEVDGVLSCITCEAVVTRVVHNLNGIRSRLCCCWKSCSIIIYYYKLSSISFIYKIICCKG